jgi:hypothetical protein
MLLPNAGFTQFDGERLRRRAAEGEIMAPDLQTPNYEALKKGLRVPASNKHLLHIAPDLIAGGTFSARQAVGNLPSLLVFSRLRNILSNDSRSSSFVVRSLPRTFATVIARAMCINPTVSLR